MSTVVDENSVLLHAPDTFIPGETAQVQAVVTNAACMSVVTEKSIFNLRSFFSEIKIMVSVCSLYLCVPSFQ